jgi:hypothetical protein
MPPVLRSALVLAVLAGGLALALPGPGRAQDSSARALCGPGEPGVTCGPGNGRRAPGGGAKVSHEGWPPITGILWKVLDDRGRTKAGGPANDELLGHHGGDRLSGGGGDDVLWGDWDPRGNTSRQRDTLVGGAGDDWIYPSHGRTTVRAGAGRDFVHAFYGRGTIDCGAGRDTVRVRQNGAFRLRGCERVRHFCAHGADGDGGCRKPGAAARRRG